MLRQLSASGPRVTVDAGSSLSAKDLSNLGAARLKAALVAEIFAADGIDAMALSARDWQLGRPFVQELVDKYKLPILAANLECGGQRPYPGHRVVESAGHRIGLVGLTEGTVAGCTVEDPALALARTRADLGDVDLVIALLPHGRRALTSMGDVSADMAIIVGPGTSVDLGGPLVIAPMNRGKTLGRADVSLAPGGTAIWSGDKLRSLTQTLERHRKSLAKVEAEPASDRQQARMKAAKRRIAAASEASEAYGDGTGKHRAVVEYIELSDAVADFEPTAAKVKHLLAGLDAAAGAPIPDDAPRVVAGAGPWLGADGCVACHATQHSQWLTTRHATAWETLRDDQHGRDPACVGCHVTGWQEPGGPQSVEQISPFRGVQCEACHQGGRAHALDPSSASILRDPPLSTCQKCHDGERDGGRFDHATYRPKVVHTK